jgi:hypothetical protein
MEEKKLFILLMIFLCPCLMVNTGEAQLAYPSQSGKKSKFLFSVAYFLVLSISTAIKTV